MLYNYLEMAIEQVLYIKEQAKQKDMQLGHFQRETVVRLLAGIKLLILLD